MIYVEDLLKGLTMLIANGTIKDNWLSNFALNVTGFVNRHSPLSTKQSEIICKNAQRYSSSLATAMRKSREDINKAIAIPVHRQQPYQSANVPREVRYLGMNKLAFRCKRDPTVVADLRALGVKQPYVHQKSPLGTTATWFSDQKVWVISIVNDNLEQVMDVISRHKFHFDQITAEYLTLCENSKMQISTAVMDDDEQNVYLNVCNNNLIAHLVYNLMDGKAV